MPARIAWVMPRTRAKVGRKLTEARNKRARRGEAKAWSAPCRSLPGWSTAAIGFATAIPAWVRPQIRTVVVPVVPQLLRGVQRDSAGGGASQTTSPKKSAGQGG